MPQYAFGGHGPTHGRGRRWLSRPRAV